jgi:hypothetical protein
MNTTSVLKVLSKGIQASDSRFSSAYAAEESYRKEMLRQERKKAEIRAEENRKQEQMRQERIERQREAQKKTDALKIVEPQQFLPKPITIDSKKLSTMFGQWMQSHSLSIESVLGLLV